MMVSPISSVRFCAGDGKVDLARPGAHSRSAEAEATTAVNSGVEKKSSTGKKIAIGAGIIVAVAALLAGLPKMFPNAIKIIEKEELANAKTAEKIGHYFAKVGEAISDYTYRPIMKLFKGGEKAAAEAAEGAAETVEGAASAAGTVA